MTDFDPYLKWLGIRDPQRPVNHYRLLGLDLFETDVDVISTAADRQMAHVRTYQSGARAELSQKILSELAVARRCLLMSEQKQAYDTELRQSIETVEPATPVAAVNVPQAKPVSQPAVAPPKPIAVNADSSMRDKRKQREKSQMLLGMVGWIGGGLAAVAVCAVLIQFGIIPGFGKKKQKIAAVEPDNPQKIRTDKPSNKNNGQNRKPPRDNDQTPRVTDNTNTPDKNTGANPRDPDFVWNRDNLNRYPPPGPNTQLLLATIGDAVLEEKIHKLGISNATKRNAEFQLLSKDHLLVGLALSQARDGSIKTMAPLERGMQGIRFGQEYGQNRSRSRTLLVAKPGYAVGAIEVSTERPMKCIRLIYMKILEDRLDTKNQYASEWFPKQVRPITRIRNSVGLPLVGAFGRYRRSSNVETLGLIGALTHDALGVVSVNTPIDSERDPFAPDKNPGVEPDLNAKMEPPTITEIEAARKEILTLYERQFRDATVNQSRINRSENARRTEILRARNKARDLANELIRDANGESEQSPTQFTLYREAASIGSRIGNLEVVSNAMREMDTRYQIDFWDLMKDAVKETENNALDTDAFVFRKTLDELIDQAVIAKKFKEADAMVDWAYNKVRKTDNVQAEKYKELGRKIGSLKKAQLAHDRALKTLNDEPSDPDANEDIGMFELLVNDDAEKALDFWAKSKNEQLLKIVELSKTTDVENSGSLVILANAWSDVGKSNRSYQDKKFLEQAKSLLQRAEDRAEGLEQRRIQKAMEDLQLKIDG